MNINLIPLYVHYQIFYSAMDDIEVKNILEMKRQHAHNCIVSGPKVAFLWYIIEKELEKRQDITYWSECSTATQEKILNKAKVLYKKFTCHLRECDKRSYPI